MSDEYGLQTDLGIDPRFWVDCGYGTYRYKKVGDKGQWVFTSWKFREKFKKDFAKYNPVECDPFVPEPPAADYGFYHLWAPLIIHVTSAQPTFDHRFTKGRK